MDLEQVTNRLDWLDDERRKDKTTITALQDRIVILEGGIDAASQQVKEVGSEVTRISVVMTRVDQFDDSLSQHRLEINKFIEDLEKKRGRREAEDKKIRQVGIDGMNKNITELRHEMESVTEVKEGLKIREEEDARLARLIEEAKQAAADIRRNDEERDRSLRLMEDGRRQDTKRTNDMQGEVAAMRKRADEQRGQVELLTTNMRKTETRLSELAAAETERREAQNVYLEKLALENAERERMWADWQKRFDNIESLSEDLEDKLEKIDLAQRTVKQAQESFEEMTERMERRINEVTEMQRLSEERFRQEWVTFKADDQKRWTNYTLTQEEQQSESGRHQERLVEQVTTLEDQYQEISDILQSLTEQTEKQLQTLLTNLRDWVADFEQTLGQSR